MLTFHTKDEYHTQGEGHTNRQIRAIFLFQLKDISVTSETVTVKSGRFEFDSTDSSCSIYSLTTLGIRGTKIARKVGSLVIWITWHGLRCFLGDFSSDLSIDDLDR